MSRRYSAARPNGRVLGREELAAIPPVLATRSDAFGEALRFMLLTPPAGTKSAARPEREVAEALQLLADALDGVAAGTAAVVPLRRG
jgi:hypothetical protein